MRRRTVTWYDKKAKKLWAEILKMLYICQSGYPGRSLSYVEMLMALYYEVTKVDPKNPKDPNRDRSILSKGHARPTLYAVPADLGYFPKGDLAGLCQIDSRLQGHPGCTKTSGVDTNTDFLGQGVSLVMGLALAAKHAGADYEVYTALDGGECQESLIWETATVAIHHKLDSLAFILDRNKLQIDGRNDRVTSLDNIMRKFNALGFECFEMDGHDMDATVTALRAPVPGRPKSICCNTAKGKDVSFMEGQLGWHGSPMNREQFERALSEQEME